MGKHWFTFDYDPAYPCDDTVPWQIVYDLDGALNGVVSQHVAAPTGSLWEPISTLALNAIVDSPPQCLADAIADSAPGATALHMYVDNYETDCSDCTDCHE